MRLFKKQRPDSAVYKEKKPANVYLFRFGFAVLAFLLIAPLLSKGYPMVFHALHPTPTHITANSDLYQEVRRNHLDYLHKVGNRKARDANWKHAEFLHDYRNGFNDNHSFSDSKDVHSVYHFYIHNKIYHADKYGNYWSYFEDHQAIGNDVFDIANLQNRLGNGNHPALTSYSKYKSGIVASQKVLRDHGVNSGVNFTKFDQYDHVPGYM